MYTADLYDFCCQGRFDAAMERLHYYPEEASSVYHRGFTPLHRLVMCDPPLHVTEALYEAHREAAFAQDSDDWTPIHHAAQESSVVVVNFFIRVAPEAFRITDSNGNTPLRIACYHGENNMIRFII